MFRPDQPDRPGIDDIPADYQPRVVVKLRDGEDVAARVASLAVAPTGAPEGSGGPEQLVPLQGQFPGARVEPLFTATTPAQLASLVRDAERKADEKAPNLNNFFSVTVPWGTDPESVCATALKLTGVEHAYVQGAPTPPPKIDASDDPRSANQGYLDAAPGGIDARCAWTLAGGDGSGVNFIDVEQGWTLDHEDLSGAGIKLISGVNSSFHGHGTAVLGEVVAQDNSRGCVGVAPLASTRVVSQHRTATNFNTADAILAATLASESGDVILLEAQTTVSGSTFLPVEVESGVWWAIRVATWLGRTVVEAGGNGSNDLDQYSDPKDGFVLRRGHNDFRDSGAIMVGAASSAAPHKRLGFSNYGSRIDCFAWGENIDTTGDGWKGTAKTLYTTSFGGTSGASPIVTGAAIALLGMTRAAGTTHGPARVREILSDPLVNTTSDDPPNDMIGVMPDLRAIAVAEGLVRQVGDFPEPTGDTRAAAIDAGHGGAVDSGHSSAYGSPVRGGGSEALEKDINLDVARRVCDRLGNAAILTRSGDYNLTLKQRIERARAARASAFVSIHSNTGRTDRAGPEVWVYGDGRSATGRSSQQLAQRIQQELSTIDRAGVPVRAGKLAVLSPELHGPGVAACLVETGSLEHPQGAARLKDKRSLDMIGEAVARGVSQYLAKDLKPKAGRALYGNPAALLNRPALPRTRRFARAYSQTEMETLPEQTCFHESAEAMQSNWWDAALPAGVLADTAPPELRELLTYLEVSYATFAPGEGAYFAALGEHLHRHGVAEGVAIDASNVAEAVRDFQSRTKGLTVDGSPGERTLWELQKDWAVGRQLGIVRCPADQVPRSGGYDHFKLRSDIADRYDALRSAVLAAGGVITSAGSFRSLDADVNASRSATSMHYSGLALDLATDTGMQNPATDTYLITQEGRGWRVYCRAEMGEELELQAVRWRNKAIETQTMTAKVIDFTALATANGFSNIPARSNFPDNYMGAEWWHFQCELPLKPYISQFGIELLSLAQYNEAQLSTHTDVWANRMKLFKKGRGGWY